jgi:hypothetical protein
MFSGLKGYSVGQDGHEQEIKSSDVDVILGHESLLRPEMRRDGNTVSMLPTKLRRELG